eukprot:3720727-Pleurochrysis_carterae.AAC.2
MGMCACACAYAYVQVRVCARASARRCALCARACACARAPPASSRFLKVAMTVPMTPTEPPAKPASAVSLNARPESEICEAAVTHTSCAVNSVENWREGEAKRQEGDVMLKVCMLSASVRSVRRPKHA